MPPARVRTPAGRAVFVPESSRPSVWTQLPAGDRWSFRGHLAAAPGVHALDPGLLCGALSEVSACGLGGLRRSVPGLQGQGCVGCTPLSLQTTLHEAPPLSQRAEPGAGRVFCVLSCLWGACQARATHTWWNRAPRFLDSNGTCGLHVRQRPRSFQYRDQACKRPVLLSPLQILEAVLRSCIARRGCPRAPGGPDLRRSGPTCRRDLPFSGRSRPPAPSPAAAPASGGTGRETGP